GRGVQCPNPKLRTTGLCSSKKCQFGSIWRDTQKGWVCIEHEFLRRANCETNGRRTGRRCMSHIKRSHCNCGHRNGDRRYPWKKLFPCSWGFSRCRNLRLPVAIGNPSQLLTNIFG